MYDVDREESKLYGPIPGQWPLNSGESAWQHILKKDYLSSDSFLVKFQPGC